MSESRVDATIVATGPILIAMKPPPFQRWTRWTDREEIDGHDQPGVYLLAKCNRRPSRVYPLAKQIIYIGETCNQTLWSRWRQFHCAAFEGRPGHSGGLTFGAHFSSRRSSAAGDGLYLAALPVHLEEPNRSAYIRYVERLLIWEYLQRFGCYPLCNRK